MSQIPFLPEGVGSSGSGEQGEQFNDFCKLINDTLTDDTAGLKVYEYDVPEIKTTDIVIINILFPESFTGNITVRNQDNTNLTVEFCKDVKGCVFTLMSVNGRYLHSYVSSTNTAARVDAPLSSFYGQINGSSGFELRKARQITRIIFQSTVELPSGTQIRIMKM